jgi:ABC-type nickel/cobalt efflux system permease component RcnA
VCEVLGAPWFGSSQKDEKNEIDKGGTAPTVPQHRHEHNPTAQAEQPPDHSGQHASHQQEHFCSHVHLVTRTRIAQTATSKLVTPIHRTER